MGVLHAQQEDCIAVGLPSHALSHHASSTDTALHLVHSRNDEGLYLRKRPDYMPAPGCRECIKWCVYP